MESTKGQKPSHEVPGTTPPPAQDAASPGVPAGEGERAGKVAELEQQVQQYKDLMLRKAAEFENFKRRAENDAATVVRFANEDLILSFLPVVDDIERSLKLSSGRGESEPLVRGLELIYQKLQRILESQGVKPLETVGQEFNVDFHDALLQTPRADVPHHTVVEEVQKGYTLNGKVIRHAQVVVSTAPQDGNPVVSQDAAGPASGNEGKS